MTLPPGEPMIDGISLLPLAKGQASPATRPGVLIETNEFSAVREGQYVYAEYTTGSSERYDLPADPSKWTTSLVARAASWIKPCCST